MTHSAEVGGSLRSRVLMLVNSPHTHTPKKKRVPQVLEMLPTLLHGAVLTHWSRVIGCSITTPVLALLYELGFAASVLGVLDPSHALFLQLAIITHQV